MADALIENVSDTAFWVAHYRGVESARGDALFRDPLAARLAGDHGKQIAQSIPLSFFTAWTIAIRTAIIDDYIRRAIAEGIDTVLNLGAGLDTRPYRMDLPAALAWIEVDYPAVIELKEQRLAQESPHCQLTRVKLDLADLAERQKLLADINARAKKMLVLTEGVVPYLSNEEAASLADDLKALEHASYWIIDYFSRAVFKNRPRMMGNKMRNAPFKIRSRGLVRLLRGARLALQGDALLGGGGPSPAQATRVAVARKSDVGASPTAHAAGAAGRLQEIRRLRPARALLTTLARMP